MPKSPKDFSYDSLVTVFHFEGLPFFIGCPEERGRPVMQISSNEVSKITEKTGLNKRGNTEIGFTDITPESLPKSVEPDPAEVAAVVEVVKAAPDVREDIVMQLKERIEKGEYKVSGDEIADMMIRRMRADRVR